MMGSLALGGVVFDYNNLYTNRMSVWLAIEITLVVVLAIAGAATPMVGPMLGLAPPLVGTFAGALIGSAAAMLGAVLTQLATTARERSAKTDRGLRETLRAAQRTLSADRLVPAHPDFSHEMPRSNAIHDGARDRTSKSRTARN